MPQSGHIGLEIVERDGNEGGLGGGERRGEVGGETVDGVLETANGDGHM